MPRKASRGPSPLSAQQALEALRNGLRTGFTALTKHVRDRMAERSFDMNDVLHLARQGAIRRPPELDIKRNNYTYVVEGQDINGKMLEIVFSVNPGGITLITGRRP